MSEQILSDRSEALSFSRSFFGYDPLEVRAFVTKMNVQLEQMRARRGPSVSGNGVVRDDDLAVLIDSTVRDISDVLEAARAAAQKIRDRAEHEASDGLAAAAEQTRTLLAAAEAEAFALRKAAWDTSTEVLESAKVEGARMRTAAERDALEIIGNAERNAHRKLAAARRDSENAIQAADLEGERLRGAALEAGQQLIRAAKDREASVEEQVAALELRYQELLREFEDLQTKLEGPPEQSPTNQISAVRVIRPGGVARGEAEFIGGIDSIKDVAAPTRNRTSNWADGSGSVRLIETPNVRARVEVDAQELADEVARLREVDAGAVVASGSDPESKGEDDWSEPGRLISVPAATARGTEAGREVAAARAPTGVGASRSTDELGVLFLQLRTKKSKIAKGPAEDSASRESRSPLDQYDRALLPVTNRALRAVKRQLTDVQSEQSRALEEHPEDWQPERSVLASYLVHALSVMEREAFERGYAAAEETTGSRLPVLRGDTAARGSATFVDALFEEVSKTVEEGRESGRSGPDLVYAVSRVYRVWRTDEAERRLRFLAGRAYHQGFLQGLGEAGVYEFRVEVNKGCEDCASLVGVVLTEDEVPVVPLHSECRCTILPA